MTGQKPQQKKRSALLAVLLLVLLAITAGAYRWVQVRHAMKVRINRQLDVLASYGYPVTLEQLNDWYRLPAGEENAADLYLKAFDRLKEGRPEQMAKMPLSGRADAAEPNEAAEVTTVELMEQYVADQNEALALLREAAKLKHCRYPVDFREGHRIELPWLPKVRACQRLLCIQMQLAVANGNVSEFMEAFAVSSALIRSLSKEPMQVSQVVRVTCLSMSIAVLEQALGRLNLTEEQLADLSDQLDTHRDNQAWVRGTAGVVCDQVHRFRNADRMMASMQAENFDAPGWVSKLYWVVGWADRDILEYLDVANCALTPSWETSEDLLNITETIADKNEAIAKTHVLANIGCSGWDQVFDLYVQHIVQLDCARAIVAVKRYALKHQAVPESLDALVPEFLDAVPIDPFVGESVRFHAQDDRVVVYSVGKDRQDNLGRSTDTERDDQSHDLSVTVKHKDNPVSFPDPDLLRLAI